MKESDFPEPHVEVWEENWDAIQLFTRYSSQMRVGLNGPIGLDFTVIHHALDRKGLSKLEYEAFVDDMLTIERAALAKIYE